MTRCARCLLLLAIFSWPLSAMAATATTAEKPKENDYELYQNLIDAIDQVEKNYVTEVKKRDLIELAIRGMLNKLDPYSSYIGKDELEQFRGSMESEFAGIGIQIASDDGQLKILSPIHGTPAYRAGLLAGDRILKIDGKSTDGMTLDEAVKKLQGVEGTSVTLMVAHPGKEVQENVIIKREKIHVDTVLGDRRKPSGEWDFMFDKKQRIGYVRLTAFSRDTAAQLRRVLTQLQKEKPRGLILDLRFNPGGLLNAAIEVCDLFISEGRIVSTKGRNNAERSWDAHGKNAFLGFPMVVLVNRYSASSSEIVAACLQDHRRAVIVGERTWGKGSVQNLIELENGKAALKLTTASYCRPSGKNIHRFPDAKNNDQWGVTPDSGFLIDLTDSQMSELIQDRRNRDILKSPSGNGFEAKTAPSSEALRPAFVDRQLQAALKHLAEEKAK